VDHILTDTLLPELSCRILEKMAKEIRIATIHVSMGAQGFEFDFNKSSSQSPVKSARKAGNKKKTTQPVKTGKHKSEELSSTTP
jgi:hypothetical protein